jgi:penicillin-insensitive murein endopeptidase
VTGVVALCLGLACSAGRPTPEAPAAATPHSSRAHLIDEPVASSSAPPAPGSTAGGAGEPETTYPPADDEALDDGAENGHAVLGAQPLRPHPLDGKSRSELEAMLAGDPLALGSMSIGSTNGGALFNAVQMPAGDHHHLVDPAHAWGTQETVDALLRTIVRVAAEFPGAAPLPIGHLSARRGGHLSPHVSHQTGRDVDVGYYYTDTGRWYARAHAKNLDRERTWAFVRTLIVESDVDLILIDHSIQRLLEEHARGIGEDPAWLDSLFRGVPGKLPPVIRHAKGHATHLHVRFFNPIAQETGRRMLELLVQRKLVDPPTSFLRHKAKNGETLGMLARKYRTTVRAIQKANGLRSTKIRAKKVYLIPRPSALRTSPQPVVIPPRRRPPPRRADSLPRSSLVPKIPP